MSDNIGNKIKELRLARGMTLEEVGNIVGVGKSTVRKWENGIIENMKRDKIAKLAQALGVSPSYLMGWSEESQSLLPDGALHVVKRRLPVLGRIACGEPVAEEEIEFDEVEEVPVDADYVLYAKGDSMIGARIYDGDLVYIKKQSTVENGDIAAVDVNGELTLKRFYYYKEAMAIHLVAENPAYRPIVISGPDMTNVSIAGKAVAVRSEIK